jgi:zinc/manganese transport system substrate-binding protein
MKFLLCLFLGISGASAQIKTVSLHPLLTDLIQQVGGEQVTVIDLIGKTGDPHHFEPSAEQIKSTQGAVLYFVSGKGLESYLPSLKNIIGNSAKLIEVGATLPSIEGACDHEHHEHDAKNEHEHSIDPHWWHSIENFRRATTVVANELSTASPTQRAYFEKNASAYRKKLEELDRWARKEIAKIPKEKRQLATAHDAFGYFCKDYQFTAIPVQGINREQAPGTAALAALMKELKDHRVTAIFPEKESNPKILTALTKDTGIALAEPLIADGTNVDTYEEMIRHNISAIVKSLSPVRE